MNRAKKSLFRLAILILLIPVVLLLLLRLFGENQMEVPILDDLTECKVDVRSTSVFLVGGDFSNAQKNQIKRLKNDLKDRSIVLRSAENSCFADTTAVYLLDTKKRLRGAYRLEQNEVNRLFVELDIIRLNENYGQGVSR